MDEKTDNRTGGQPATGTARGPLAVATAALEAARQKGDPATLAPALVTFGELMPAFRYRTVPAREALLEASKLLPPLFDPFLEGRCLLRLAELRMIEGLLDQAAQLGQAAQARLSSAPVHDPSEVSAGAALWAGPGEAAFGAGCLRVRILRRRGQAEAADRLMAEVATAAAEFAGRKAGQRGLSAFSLALAEGQIEAEDAEATGTLRTLLGALDRGRAEAHDARFAAHQGIALLAQVTGHLSQAVSHLRTATQLVKEHDAKLDLLECRLALGTALSAIGGGKLAEARRVLQVVVDSARDLGQEEHRLLGLTGLSAVLSTQGAYRGAVDLALEGAVGYGQRGNLLGYVRSATLAAHVLLSHGREAAAIELLMIGASSLRHTLGEEAARLLDTQLDAIHIEMGEEKFESLCNDIVAARAARRRAMEP